MLKEELNTLDSLTASYNQAFTKVAKEHLRDYVEAVTDAVPAAGRNFFICPCCKSGTGNNNHFTPAFHLYRTKSGDLHFKCHACGIEGDIFTLAGLLNNTHDFLTERKIIADFLGVDLAHRSPLTDLKISDAKVSAPQGIAESKTLRRQAHEYILYCQNHIQETDYFAKRGFTDETIKRFALGYDPKHAQAVIPFNQHYYMSRNTKIGADQKGEHKHYKPRGLTQPLFNVDALAQAKNALFVVEAPIDAMSIEQSGGSCIALGGTSTAFFEKMIRIYHPDCHFVLAFDNDKAGFRAQSAVEEILHTYEIPYSVVSHYAFRSHKDANAILMADCTLLRDAVAYEKELALGERVPFQPLGELKTAAKKLVEQRTHLQPSPARFYEPALER